MVQTTLDYAIERVKVKRKLGKTERRIIEIFNSNPQYIELRNQNKLVRRFWSLYGDVSCESITRVCRKLRASGEYDTMENVKHRSNHEVAYRNHFNI